MPQISVQELVIVIAAKNNNPTILNLDFLKYSGIIPSDWELARQPVLNNNFAHVVFTNGVSIVAETNRVIFIEQVADIVLQIQVKTYNRKRRILKITLKPAPYSEDLCQKAITAVERGERKSNVSRMLNIRRNTLDLWLKRKEQTGNCQAITHYRQGNRHKITNC